MRDPGRTRTRKNKNKHKNAVIPWYCDNLATCNNHLGLHGALPKLANAVATRRPPPASHYKLRALILQREIVGPVDNVGKIIFIFAGDHGFAIMITSKYENNFLDVVNRPNYLSLKDESSEFVMAGRRGAPGGDGVSELGWSTMNSQVIVTCCKIIAVPRYDCIFVFILHTGTKSTNQTKQNKTKTNNSKQ